MQRALSGERGPNLKDQSRSSAMAFFADSVFALWFLPRWVRPIPRKTLGAFSELNIVVADDLDAVAPRIVEVEET
jgi:hypothetical protein